MTVEHSYHAKCQPHPLSSFGGDMCRTDRQTEADRQADIQQTQCPPLPWGNIYRINVAYDHSNLFPFRRKQSLRVIGKFRLAPPFPAALVQVLCQSLRFSLANFRPVARGDTGRTTPRSPVLKGPPFYRLFEH